MAHLLDFLPLPLRDLALDVYSSFGSGSPVLLVLAAVGLWWIASTVLSLLRLVLSVWVLPGKSLRKFGTPGKTYALITGPTDGLGLQFTHHLAKKGFNLLLASRSASKLSSLAAELSSSYPSLRIRTCAIDFSTATPADYAALGKLVQEVGEVGILINNVGKSHDIPVPFAETARTEMEDIVTINVLGTLRVTALVVPGMVERKRGLILTMGSFGGLLPTPLLATYSGSKAFLQQWSSALGAELAPHGVTVELVLSYLITGPMSKVRRASAMIPTPKQFVASVMGSIGRSGGAQGFAYTSTPWWSHALMQWALGRFVGFMGQFVVGRNRVMHEEIRKRALRKRERELQKDKKGL